jgi:ribosomal protein L1
MPNPKAGTISTNPDEVAKKYSGGLLKWKAEPKFPLVHQMIAKISQDDAQIVENAEKFVEAVGPQNITSITIKTTMSPGLAINLS